MGFRDPSWKVYFCRDCNRIIKAPTGQTQASRQYPKQCPFCKSRQVRMSFMKQEKRPRKGDQYKSSLF